MPRMRSSMGSGVFRFPAGSGSLSFLSDSFSGATVLLSLTRENAAYHGSALTISRSNGAASTDIGFVGAALDLAALNAYLAGGTAFVDTWYDQSGNTNNATASGAARFQVIVDTDGLPTLVGGTATGMTVADAASHKTTKIDAYVVSKVGVTFNQASDDDSCVVVGWTPTGDPRTVARWVLAFDDGGAEFCRNGTSLGVTSPTLPSTIPLGNGHRTNWGVWNYSSERQRLKRNNVTLWDQASTADVTYSGTGALCIGSNKDGTQNGQGQSFRAVVIYGTTRADASGINSYLFSRWPMTEFPTSFSSGDGFLWAPQYFPTFVWGPSNDSNGIQWWHEHGGYPETTSRGPSCAIASNVNNGTEYIRFETYVNDRDAIVTGAERAERGGYLNGDNAAGIILPGDDAAYFNQLRVEAGPTQSGSWALTNQIHTDTGGSADFIYLGLKGDQFQVVTQRGGVDTLRGSAVPFLRDTDYAYLAILHWSKGSSDTLVVYLGLNGGTLTKIVDISGAIFPTDCNSGYIKQGLYRGFAGDNAGRLAIRVAGHRFSKTASAFNAFITSQPALPTHA